MSTFNNERLENDSQENMNRQFDETPLDKPQLNSYLNHVSLTDKLISKKSHTPSLTQSTSIKFVKNKKQVKIMSLDEKRENCSELG